MTFQSDVITVEVSEHVATVWLDRPSKLNAMGRDFWIDLPRAMQSVSEAPEVRVVIIAAKGRSFSVGLDLVEFAGVNVGTDGASPAAKSKNAYRQIKAMQTATGSVADCPKPVIAAIHGFCIGGGIDLITAADIRLAAADAVFSIRETKIAIVADMGTLQRAPSILSSGDLAELAYTGKDIDAERAVKIGLVNDVYDDLDALHKAARAMAEEIAANSPLVVQGTKHILRAGEDRTVDEALDYVAMYNAAHLQSADLVEAMAAYSQGRPPIFTGE